jgi:hypothetical protein
LARVVIGAPHRLHSAENIAIVATLIPHLPLRALKAQVSTMIGALRRR